MKNTKSIIERLNELNISLESTKEVKRAYSELDGYYESIKHYLPDNLKHKLMNDMDDTITDLLILYEEYFYKHGYNDCKKHVTIFNKFLSCFKNITCILRYFN